MRLVTSFALLTAACGGGSTDIKGTLVFADRSDAEIARIIGAAGGGDMFSAQAQVDSFSDMTDPCPAVTTSGRTVTITGGCTTMDGMMIAGSATIDNPLAYDQIEYNFSEPSVYQLSGLTFTQQAFSTMYDGTFRVEDSFTVYDADITTNMLGIGVRSDLHYECGGSDCDLDGSGIELIGVGGALVSGTVHVGGAANASYTLRGVDTLTAHVSAGCISWSISGSGRQKTCP